MRLMTLPMISAALLLLVASGYGEDGKDTEVSAETIQGEWTVVSLGIAGYELKGTPQQAMRASFTKDRMVVRPAYEISFSTSVSIGGDGINAERTTTISLSERNQEATF